MKAQGLQPKNHRRENVQQLRELQRKNRLNSERKKNERQEPFKMSRFKNVLGKVKQQVDAEHAPDTDGDNDELPDNDLATNRTNYLRARAMDERLGQRREQLRQKIQDEQISKSDAVRKERRPPVPRKGEILRTEPRQEKDFVHENWQKARKLQFKTTNSATSSQNGQAQSFKHQNYGKVPNFIVKRNRERREREETERLEMEFREECPPGMTIMAEDDRLETIDKLKQSYEKLNRELHSISIVSDSLRLRKKKEQLEKKLKDVEEAISIFSKKVVYITEE